jgi:hypothetical protein
MSMGMNIAMAGVGSAISGFTTPYISKAVGAVVSNSILGQMLNQGLSFAVSGFAVGTLSSLSTGASFGDALENGWSSSKTGFAMGATMGAIMGTVDYIKAKKVSNADHAIKPQTEATTLKNTTVNNNTQPAATTNEPMPDLGKYPAGHINTDRLSGTGTPNSSQMQTSTNGRPLKIVRYNSEGNATYRIDLKVNPSQPYMHGHQLSVPGQLGTAIESQHIPFMLIPPSYFNLKNH